MQFLKEWITNITLVIIFTMLIDMLMPNSDMKRFIKVIMGLLIILVIIKPFLMVKGLGLQFETTMLQTAAYIEDPNSSDNKSMEVFKNNTALSVYKQNLTEKVTEIVKEHKELKDRAVRVNLEIDNDINSQSFGSIKAMQIFVDRGNSSVILASSIQPVKINTKTVINKKQTEYNGNNSKISQDLEVELRDTFGLEDTAITVEIQE